MRRLSKALFSNGLSSVMSLILSVLIARSGGTDDLGIFGVAFAAYLLVQLIVRDAGANTVGAVLPSNRKVRLTAQRVSLMAAVLAVPVLIAGIALNFSYLMIMGVAIHGLCLYDYSKTLSLTLDDGKIAIYQDGILFVVFLVAASLSFNGVIDSVGLMSVWAIAGALLGYLAAWFQNYKLNPTWSGDVVELRTSLVFGLQSLLGGGSVHVITFLLNVVGGPIVIGALRGASTLIGPANVITSSLQPLLITYFARTAPRAGAIHMPAVLRSAAALVGVHILVTSTLTICSLYFGEVILGEAWDASAPLLLIVAVDSVLVAIGAAPLAAHRSLWASGRLARVNMLMVSIRLPVITSAAFLYGAQGAAFGFLVTTFLSSTLWWGSFLQIQRR